MKQQLINTILRKMSMILNDEQMIILENTLLSQFKNVKVENECTEIMTYDPSLDNNRLLSQFKRSLQMRCLSERTIEQYVYTTKRVLDIINKPAIYIESTDIKLYLSEWQHHSDIKRTTLNNTIRYISAFFNWMEKDDIIKTNPMRKIDAVKLNKTIKKPFSPAQIETLKCGAIYERDKALIEVLLSTGARISEVAAMNVSDIHDGQCIVLGKGSKERVVYFSDPALLHLNNYIKNRKGDSDALFTSLKAPYNRMTARGLAQQLNKLGVSTNVNNVHPHRFRRTMATNAINRGMPLQELQLLMGHEKIDTTTIYCTPNQDIIRCDHKKFVA